jgi:hypothetical protein
MNPQRKIFIACFVVLTAIAGVAQQQQRPNIIAFGSDSPERGTTRVGYWNRAKNQGTGQFAIDHGRPIWKKEYEDAGAFDKMTKGSTWRLGENFWTTFDTDIPLKVGGQSIPIGAWYLGVERSADGAQWNLVFIDPAKARAAHVDASEIQRAPVSFKAPLKFERVNEVAQRLVIGLEFKQQAIRDVTLRIRWGQFQLTAPVEVPPLEG